MSDLDAIIKKIQALRARAADAASTEAEAEMAIRIVNDLLTKHNLTMTEVEVKSAGIISDKWSKGQKHRAVEEYGFKGIEQLCSVKIYKSHGSDTLNIVGSPADVASALYFFDIVSHACTSCFEVFKAGWGYYTACQKSSARMVSQSFKIGVSSRLGIRMCEMAKQDEPTTHGTGLVLVKNALIEEFLSDLKLKDRTDTTRGNQTAYAAGS